MGRMREALKRAEAKATLPRLDPPSLATIWPEENLLEEEDNSIPFIEVGGPRPAQGHLDPAAVLAERALNLPITPAPAPAAVLPTETGPILWSVAFRSLPREWDDRPAPATLAPELVAFHHPQHAISSQYRSLVASLLAHAPSARARVFLFTGAVPGAGTTTVLLNSAITMTQQGLRVLAIDAHLRGSALAERLGMPASPGLREVLGGLLPVEKAMRETPVEKLLALTAGAPQAASPTRLVGETMRALLRQVRDQFDVVLVDGPRWDGRPEVVALGCACDAVYLCLPEKEQDTTATEELMQIIPEQGAPLGGCIVTTPATS